MKSIGLLTGGGDSPGINTAVRAVVRTAISHNLTVKGSSRGCQGLIDGKLIDLTCSSVSHIIRRGGNPSARDCVLSSRLGHAADKSAIEGRDKVMVGGVNNHMKLTPLKMTWSKKKDIDFEIVELAKILR